MDPFDELENVLGEQAHRAFIELVFPGQIESDGVTNGPRNWNELPNNYQKALNLGFGVPIKDSTQVHQQAQGLLGLKTGDKALFAVEKEMRLNIGKLVKPVESSSTVEVQEALERHIQSLKETPWIARDIADVVLICVENPSFAVGYIGFR